MLDESPRRRNAIRRRLAKIDMSPWHDFYGVQVWRNGPQEYKLALGQQILRSGSSVDDAVDFIMANGWEV